MIWPGSGSNPIRIRRSGRGICCGRRCYWLRNQPNDGGAGSGFQEFDCFRYKLLRLLERQHVAAVVEDIEASARDLLGIELADSDGEQLVVAAPEEERGALDTAKVLGEAGVV